MSFDLNIPGTPPEFIARIKRAVISGGGTWCGVQESIPPSPNRILFNSPQTGSTLSVPLKLDLENPEYFSDSELSAAVRTRIEESDKKFADAKISVKVAQLRELRQRAQFVVDELNKICEGK